MTDALLSVPNYAPGAGRLPGIMPDYLGYYDSGYRQLVFVYSLPLRSANIYISTHGWGQACATMREAKLPADLLVSADEAQWVYACWSAATLRFNRVALENAVDRKFRFPPFGSGASAVVAPSPASKEISLW